MSWSMKARIALDATESLLPEETLLHSEEKEQKSIEAECADWPYWSQRWAFGLNYIFHSIEADNLVLPAIWLREQALIEL